MSKPVKIDNNKIIEVVETLIKEEKYDEITARNIAKLSSISLGSIYNHFKSKNEIIALVLLSSWKDTIKNIDINVDIKEGIKNIYEGIYEFSFKFNKLFNHEKENNKEYLMYLDKHQILVKEINDLVNKLFLFNKTNIEDDLSFFISENLLNFATKLFNYKRLENIFIKLIGGNNFNE